MARTVRIKFAHRYKHPILDGDKRATIRYGFERNVEPGDYLHLLTPDGDHFGSAVCERAYDLTAFDAATRDIDGHRSYDGVADLLDHLRPFYPNADLTPNSDLTAIGWKGAHKKGYHRWCEVCRTV